MTELEDAEKRAPTKHEASIKAIASCIPILRNPIFLMDDRTPADYTGRFAVNGALQVKVDGPPLLAKDADVFHALVHLAWQHGLEERRVEFVSGELLELMRWGRRGSDYRRLRQAIDTLYRVSIEIDGLIREDIRAHGAFRILTAKRLYSDDRESQQQLLFKNWVRFSEDFFEILQRKNVKALHPAFFALRSRLEKRLFELIAVRASDLDRWRVSVLTLRDLLPLLGKKYKFVSGIRQVLTPALDRLTEAAFIHKYEFAKEADGESFLVIWPNSDYFYSERSPARPRRTSERPARVEAQESELDEDARACVALLLQRGVARDEAERLAAEHTGATIQRQVGHWDYLVASGKGPNSVGWLITAIEKDYPLPPGLTRRADEAAAAERRSLLSEAEAALKQGDLELAVSKAELLLAGGDDRRGREILIGAKKELERRDELKSFSSTMSEEEHARLLERAEIEAAKLARKPVEVFRVELAEGWPSATGILKGIVTELQRAALDAKKARATADTVP